MESNRHSRAGGNLVSELITDNIDVWTSAIKKRNSQGRGSNSKVELTGVKKLRELILELAVRGKLVPQDPNDEPASVLLENVIEEKEKLVAEKIINKQKSFRAISNKDKILGLPRSWSHVRLGEVGYWAIGSGFPKAIQGEVNKEVLVSKVSDMNLDGNEKYIMYSNNSVDFDVAKQNRLKIHKEGTVIFPKIGGAIATNKRRIIFKPTVIDNNCLGITPYSCFESEYLYLYLSSIDLTKYQVGTSVPALSQSVLELIILGLPPLAEQHRIVAKVDELMALCDQLEQQTEQSLTAHQTLVEELLSTLTQSVNADDLTAMDGGNEGIAGANSFQASWQRIAEHFDILFTTEHSIEQLKQTILQLAVMGKLVPQNPSDEPASVLLEKIAKEKAQLIKDKKIKKQPALPPITEEEKPFELPSGWEYERIGTFGIVGTGSTPSRSNPDYWQPAEYNWVSSGETSEFFVNETKEKVSALAIKETNVSLYPAGTLIVAMYGQGKTRGQITELLSEAGTNQACAAIRLVNDSKSHKNYVKLCFRKAYEELRSHASGGAQPNLNVGKISNAILPLPPLAEQQRIVAKVDELMALCEQLKARLSDAQTTQLHLADAVVENALTEQVSR